MSQHTSSFLLLDEGIQRFIWAEGWTELRDAQELAIPLLIQGNQDVIIAAATAAGKTEAAFFPALTRLLRLEAPGLIVYISPLKALINDQCERLTRLCDLLEVPVWPWHGDITSATKRRFLEKPSGVLLITPESLEATLCNRGTSLQAIFSHVLFLVIDELHAFIGSERGKQLQSILHRIDRAINRSAPRVGLSATLGDMSLAAEFLRPRHGAEVTLVQSKSSGAELKVLVKGYERSTLRERDKTSVDQEGDDDDAISATPRQIATHLFNSLRGANNLIFPNSRSEVERYTYLLNSLCEAHSVPREFWPHHGSLSKEIRSETEAALKQRERPATAVCTNTLELGIDIGAVESVAQIGPPPSVASLRQRLGRSGRRKGHPAVLRGYTVEHALVAQQPIDTELRLDTFEMTAMITLLVEGWCEPPRAHGLHWSTLVQQILSFIAQNGGATIGELYELLCDTQAPFAGISKGELASLIRELGRRDLLVQDSSGLLLHGSVGEKCVNHYNFYAAFLADEEFRVVSSGRALGTLPVSQLLTVGQRILFAGKTWRVEQIEEELKTIYVSRSKGGVAPAFSGGAGRVHTQVRQRMRDLYESLEVPVFLDRTARRFLEEGRRCYRGKGLDREKVLDQGAECYILTWMGDSTNEALAALIRRHGLVTAPAGPGVSIVKSEHSIDHIIDLLRVIATETPPTPELLLEGAKNLYTEKWDWALPEELLQKSYASLRLDVSEAIDWARNVAGSREGDTIT